MRNSGDRLEDRINPREYICKYDYIIYHSVTIIIICYCKIKKERNREGCGDVGEKEQNRGKGNENQNQNQIKKVDGEIRSLCWVHKFRRSDLMQPSITHKINGSSCGFRITQNLGENALFYIIYFEIIFLRCVYFEISSKSSFFSLNKRFKRKIFRGRIILKILFFTFNTLVDLILMLVSFNYDSDCGYI